MPRTRLFRFYITVDGTAVPQSINNDFAPDITGYCLNYDIGELAGPVHTSEDLGGWKRVDIAGISDLALSTVEKSHFWIGVSVLPNSVLDPDAPESKPFLRALGMHTDDFVPVKASEWPDLVKKFPDGVFILRVDLVAVYTRIAIAGSTGLEAARAQAGIRLEDIVYDAPSPTRDASGKVIATHHDIIYWSDDLRLSGSKYVP
jgi:hypothetical protein